MDLLSGRSREAWRTNSGGERGWKGDGDDSNTTDLSLIGKSDETDNARLSRLTDAIPDTLAHKMRAAHLAGERKVVTFLFADVVGSTAIAAKIDAEVWTEIMNHVFERLSQAILPFVP